MVKGKQTLLLEEKLVEHNFGDAKIANECEQGLRLTGKLCHSQSFRLKPENQRVKALDPALLRELALDLRKEACTKVADQKVDEISKEVFRLTTDQAEGEVGKG